MTREEAMALVSAWEGYRAAAGAARYSKDDRGCQLRAAEAYTKLIDTLTGAELVQPEVVKDKAYWDQFVKDH